MAKREKKQFQTIATVYVAMGAAGNVNVSQEDPGDLVALADACQITNGGCVYRLTLGGYEGAAPGISLQRLLTWKDKATGEPVAAFSGKRLGMMPPAVASEVAGMMFRLSQAGQQAAA